MNTKLASRTLDRDLPRDNRDASRACRAYEVRAGKAASVGLVLRMTCFLALSSALTLACAASESAESNVDDVTAAPNQTDPSIRQATREPAPTSGVSPDARSSGTPGDDTSAAAPAGEAAAVTVTSSALLAKVKACAKKLSTAPYANDVGEPSNVDVCALPGAVFFKSDLDVDCDGKRSSVCNVTADPDYQSETAAVDSKGSPLDAATLPFIVVPGVSSKWSYQASGIGLGSVAAVLYNGKVEYGIVGDIGPKAILGEASYAMAKRLGINPDPRRGGTSNEVIYIVFSGDVAKVKIKESHEEAVKIGTARAQQLLASP